MSAPRGTEGLQPQELVLTIFGAHVRRRQQVWSGGLVEILEGLDFTSGAARAALARLVKRKLLARTRDGRRAFYSVTQRSSALLSEGDDRIFSFGRVESAVDLWTVVWHAIPEDRRVTRSRLASRLRFLGFGAVQDATWVAARDREQKVRLLLDELDIKPYASVMVGHMSPEIPPLALIGQAWRVDEVRERYEAFLSEFEGVRRAAVRKRMSSAETFRTRILLLHRFRGFPHMDPELPREIDPLRELRARAIECFDDAYAALERPATEYFWQTVGP
ncbi:MAG: phenylacetic acid degradation protein PaaX [Conexibacteraceae bacterium]|nr:phenylacetic acid degradation protein PaaX [Conexibacteraceae bacterium]